MAWTVLSQLGEPSSARNRRAIMEKRVLVKYGMFDFDDNAKYGKNVTELLDSLLSMEGMLHFGIILKFSLVYVVIFLSVCFISGLLGCHVLSA